MYKNLNSSSKLHSIIFDFLHENVENAQEFKVPIAVQDMDWPLVVCYTKIAASSEIDSLTDLFLNRECPEKERLDKKSIARLIKESKKGTEIKEKYFVKEEVAESK